MGQPIQEGTGKSHIAIALTVAAIQAGHTALYRSAFDLAQDMAEAEATGTRKDLISRLCKVDLLVLEDLGMKRLPPTAAEDLLEVFVRRYEKGAIILTTNRPLEDWGQVLGDTAAAGAILDRFLHHAEVIRLQGRSYRMHNRRELRTKQAETTLTGKSELSSIHLPLAAFDPPPGGRFSLPSDMVIRLHVEAYPESHYTTIRSGSETRRWFGSLSNRCHHQRPKTKAPCPQATKSRSRFDNV